MKGMRLVNLALCSIAIASLCIGCGNGQKENAKPAANAGDDHSIQVGDAVYYTGSGVDADGSISLYEWDFNGDGVYDWSDSGSCSATYIWNTPGTYTSVLRVTDNQGASTTDSCTVTVKSSVQTFNLSGTWSGEWHRNDGKETGTMTAQLLQTGTELSGVMTVTSTTFGVIRDTAVSGTVEGKAVIFGMAVTVDGNSVTIDYTGTISDNGDYMEGTYTMSTGYSGTWIAVTGNATIPPTSFPPSTTQTTIPATSPSVTTTVTTASPQTTTTTARPAYFNVSDLVIEPNQVMPGETINISVLVTNTGGTQGTYDVELLINGQPEQIKSVNLAPGNEETVVFATTKSDSGTYRVDVDGQTGSFTVMLPIALRIQVTASTWREAEPYDIYSALEDNLTTGGIKVVTDPSESYDATLHVDYAETQGRQYTSGEYGTNIQCNLELKDAAGDTLFTHTIAASTSVVVYGTTLYKNAVNNFLDKLYFKYLTQMLAIHFGFGDEISVLTSALLEDDDKDVRVEATQILGEIGNSAPVGALIQALFEDKEYTVRAAAAQALGKIGDPGAIDPLKQSLLEDDNSKVRAAAAKALGVVGNVDAAETLCHALINDVDQSVRSEAAIALGLIGDAGAVETLIQALSTDEYWYVRSSSAKALGEIGDNRAITPLTQALTDENESVRYWADWALKQIQG